MAAVEITISGVLYDKLNRTSQQVVLVGEGSLTGLGVGGGPMPPGPGRPPSGPVDPGYGYPQHPVDPGYGYPIRPVDPGYGVPIGGLPHPEHPIALPPDPPTEPPTEPPTNPPDPRWQWVWTPAPNLPGQGAWIRAYVPTPGVDPSPKA